MMKITIILLSIISGLFINMNTFAFDQQHKIWDQILKQSVHPGSDGNASRVDYKYLKENPGQLNGYLKSLSQVTNNEFSTWTDNQQKAFLINAYNAFTVQLILTHYPDIKSIKDLGSFFISPWKKSFFILLGQSRSLDDVEHGMLRRPGVYDDPYIHFAVVCASIACPALRNRAFTADNVEQQLKDAVLRFLSDKTRNRFNSVNKKLEVSKIFDWYEEDFTRGYRDLNSINDLFARYAIQLTDKQNFQQLIRQKKVKIGFLDYDWRLNDLDKKTP